MTWFYPVTQQEIQLEASGKGSLAMHKTCAQRRSSSSPGHYPDNMVGIEAAVITMLEH